MEITSEKIIFFVDDEPQVRKAVSQTLEEIKGCSVYSFAGPLECLEALRKQRCHLLITDVNMPDMDGVQLLKQIKSIRPQLRIILVTGYGDVPMAVEAVKAGALDFIEKPLNEKTFLPLVERVLKDCISEEDLSGKCLTKTEIKILKLIAEGLSNKEIAVKMRRSVRTIENHRYRLAHKMNADSTAELVKNAIQMGLVEA
jgi:two-component system response regulator TtrR